MTNVYLYASCIVMIQKFKKEKKQNIYIYVYINTLKKFYFFYVKNTVCYAFSFIFFLLFSSSTFCNVCILDSHCTSVVLRDKIYGIDALRVYINKCNASELSARTRRTECARVVLVLVQLLQCLDTI